MAKQRQRKRRSQNQDSSAARGGFAGMRRQMQRTTGKGDKTLKYILWGTGALVGFALLWVIFAP